MTAAAFRHMLDALPSFAEEGALCTRIPVKELVSDVARASDLSTEVAAAIVATAQRLLDSLALLDRRQLHLGHWQFVSFPAHLLARSLLSATSDEDQDFLEPGYWEQGAHRPADVIEQQRELLRRLETQRVLAHRRQAAQPIRFVYVAWGLIRFDGRFLLHHREDRTRRQTGNYILPGGRFNLSDLPAELQTAQILPRIQRAESSEAMGHLDRTFVREMLEEASLRHKEHYDFRAWRRLKPYREVEGSHNNHAYTEYLIQVFEVSLTASGQVRLFEKLCESPERFTWFSPEDVARKARLDGKTAYLDALHADLGETLYDALSAVSEAFADRPICQDETDSLDIPLDPEFRVLRGKTGKEKPIDASLSNEDCVVLFGLAWHAKRLGFANVGNAVLLPGGWVKVEDDDVIAQANTLGKKLRQAGLDLVECRDQVFFRLSVAPDILFFDKSLFRYDFGTVEGGENRRCWFRLRLDQIDTPFGRTAGIDQEFGIPHNMMRTIESILRREDPELNHSDFQKVVRDQIDAHTKPLGLRKFVRVESKAYSIPLTRAQAHFEPQE